MIITKNHIELSATELTEFTSEELYVIMGIDPSKPCGEAEISYAESQRLWTEINGDFFDTETEEDVFCTPEESITQQKFIDNEPTKVGRRCPKLTPFN
jgi:hypothetical protein